MSIGNINGVKNQNVYNTPYTGKNKASETNSAKEAKAAEVAKNSGVVYEPSTAVTESKKYTPNTEVINQLKADAQARTAQLRSLVEKLMGKQVNAFGEANDIWKFLADGKVPVDAATKEQAEKDIAEDGYWGVNQTSDRIIDFATALTGGDPDKIESMRTAFQEGYAAAEKTWGKELPEISKRTYAAVMVKFDKLAAAAAGIEE